jgi:glycosyltransferase involved in cell wall biosynthesis
MRVLVWQWGRRGAGPRFAAGLKLGFEAVAGTEAALSMSAGAELLREPDAPCCELLMRTYEGLGGFALQWALAPWRIASLAARLRTHRLDVALCAMAGPLDLLMAAALRRAGVPFAVIVHDADSHPGDGFPLQMRLQRALVRRADAVVTLSAHVADRLAAQGLIPANHGADRAPDRSPDSVPDRPGGKPLIRSRLPPFAFGPAPPPPRAHGGPLRLLCFGRLLPYKGHDLLAEALARLGPRADLVVRVVGFGPESAPLAALRRLPGVTVENRWVPEGELAALLAWSDALVLPYREASQSGVGAAAIAAGRWIVATRVGGMEEQLGAETLARFAEPTAASLAEALDALLAAGPTAGDVARDVPGAWRMVAEDLAARLAPLAVRA